MTTDHTPQRKVRVSDPLWLAYDTVCRRVFGRSRSEDLVEHMRDVVREYGSEEEVRLLDEAEEETTERRARKGGRPRKGE